MKTSAPYLFFNGNAKEAMNFYKSCFGGELKVMTYAEAPAQAQGGCPEGSMPPNPNLVMHANLMNGEFMLMASDDPTGEPKAGSNIQICLQPETVEETDRIFAALSKGGQIKAPLSNTFWGAYFGMLQDKYGFMWMFNCQVQK